MKTSDNNLIISQQPIRIPAAVGMSTPDKTLESCAILSEMRNLINFPVVAVKQFPKAVLLILGRFTACRN